MSRLTLKEILNIKITIKVKAESRMTLDVLYWLGFNVDLSPVPSGCKGVLCKLLKFVLSKSYEV